MEPPQLGFAVQVATLHSHEGTLVDPNIFGVKPHLPRRLESVDVEHIVWVVLDRLSWSQGPDQLRKVRAVVAGHHLQELTYILIVELVELLNQVALLLEEL